MGLRLINRINVKPVFKVQYIFLCEFLKYFSKFLIERVSPVRPSQLLQLYQQRDRKRIF